MVPAGSPEETLARQVNFDRLPRHIAVIMDGNGRWAAQRHLPRVEGHRAGIESVRDVVEDLGPARHPVLTLYAFSVENWKRPDHRSLDADVAAEAVSAARAEHAAAQQHPLPGDRPGRRAGAGRAATSSKTAEEQTASNTGMLFNIALNYGGRAEIVEAARRAHRVGRATRTSSTRRASRASSTPPASPIPIC